LLVIILVSHIVTITWPLYRTFTPYWYKKFTSTGAILNFSDMLTSPEGAKSLKTFLRSEFAVENLLFWDAINILEEESEAADVSDIDAARKIRFISLNVYALYIKQFSPLQVNIPVELRVKIEDSIKKKQPTLNLYKEAQVYICSLMEDAFSRFILSPGFSKIQAKIFTLTQPDSPIRQSSFMDSIEKNVLQTPSEIFNEQVTDNLFLKICYCFMPLGKVDIEMGDISSKGNNEIFCEINYSDIKILSPVGKGKSGEVFQGIWNDKKVGVKLFTIPAEETTNTINPAPIVVVESDQKSDSYVEVTNKKPEETKQHALLKASQNFIRETSIIKAINSGAHANVVRCYGYCSNPPALIMEFCANGSLYDLIFSRFEKKFIGWTGFLGISLGIARGLSYIHTKGLVHRDLHAKNVLLDNICKPKITDFGLSDFTEHNTPSTLGSYIYHVFPPEVTNKQSEYTSAGDIWMFGVLMVEIITHKGIESTEKVLDTISLPPVKDKPELEVDLIIHAWELAGLCCSENIKKRPSSETIVSTLLELINAKGTKTLIEQERNSTDEDLKNFANEMALHLN